MEAEPERPPAADPDPLGYRLLGAYLVGSIALLPEYLRECRQDYLARLAQSVGG